MIGLFKGIRIGTTRNPATLFSMIGMAITTFVLVCAAPAQTYQVIHTFSGDAAGGFPGKWLVVDSSGNVYGTTIAGGILNNGTVFKVNKNGVLSTIYSFAGRPDGVAAFGRLLRDGWGNIYGTTSNGGGLADAGSVFRLDRTGSESVLYGFAGRPDAANPEEGMVRDSAGNLYGTTNRGGAIDAGTVFKLDAAGHETVLHSFGGPEGSYPQGPVVFDSGNLYGTVPNAAAGGCVYQIDKSGNFRVLYTFRGGADGHAPTSILVLDELKNIYGVTSDGGTHGFGTVFKLEKTGKKTTLYNFKGGWDGKWPSGLIRDESGNLYGTMGAGGDSNQGTIFKLDRSGHKKVLYRFRGGKDGAYPYGGVVRDSSGNLYGTTYWGGAYNQGTIYKLSL